MLRIARGLYEQLIAHCRDRYPKEACGYLAADAGGTVVTIYPMTNVEDSPIGYAMDPREQLQAEKRMRQRGERLVGIYHSHTASAASPSSVDVSLAISPDVSYVVVSLQDHAQPVVKSYRIAGVRVTEEPVRIASS